MHIIGPYLKEFTGENLVYAIFINGVFNTGVTCFMLISGYFGIKRSVSKAIKLWYIVLLYSIIDFGISCLLLGEFSFKDLVCSLFPLSTNKYWFITAYMLIFIISPYVNNTIQLLSKKEYQHLLLVMICIFYVAPTLFKIEILNDGGKGVVHLCLVYLIGRYIRLHMSNFHIRLPLLISIILSILGAGMALNYVVICLFTNGLYAAPFSRDCSVIILAGSVAIFLFFRQIQFYNYFINWAALSVFSIYIMEYTFRKVIMGYGWFPYQENGIWYQATLLVGGIMFAGIILDKTRGYLLHNFESSIQNKINVFFQNRG